MHFVEKNPSQKREDFTKKLESNKINCSSFIALLSRLDHP